MDTTGREHEDKKQAEEGMGSWERHLLPEGHTLRGLGGLQRPEEPSMLGEAGPNPAVAGESPCPPPAPPLPWLTGGVYVPPLAP